ncbi:membrane protein [Streptomyces sp. PRh5]|uniref:Rv1733c family protein n=1 Tax=Streptomyces sp. PRh5 TaxID=1158056 RepID=UPI000446E36B|nr:hypothetical protein [Streptomyces sp. PRh5]EXU64049.1 membrane protein [Streptomyces sp. PRh5]
MDRGEYCDAHGLGIRTYMRQSASGNPLLRRSDRVQFWVSVLLMALLAVGLPAASLNAGCAVYTSQMHTAHVQAAQRHQLTAHLIGDPVDNGTGRCLGRVRWTGADGIEHTAVAHVARRATRGADVTIWVDRHGDVVEAPLRPAVARTTGWIAGTVTAGAVTLVILGLQAGVARVMDRRKQARWGVEWDLLEPRWSRRLP